MMHMSGEIDHEGQHQRPKVRGQPKHLGIYVPLHNQGGAQELHPAIMLATCQQLIVFELPINTPHLMHVLWLNPNAGDRRGTDGGGTVAAHARATLGITHRNIHRLHVRGPLCTSSRWLWHGQQRPHYDRKWCTIPSGACCLCIWAARTCRRPRYCLFILACSCPLCSLRYGRSGIIGTWVRMHHLWPKQPCCWFLVQIWTAILQMSCLDIWLRCNFLFEVLIASLCVKCLHTHQ